MTAASLSAAGRGLASAESVFIPKGIVAAGIAAGYNNYNASEGANLVGLATNADGKVALFNAQVHAAWFVKDDLAIGISFGYGSTSVDGNSLNLMDLIEVSDRHVRREIYDASLTLRRYLSIFDSQTFGLFVEGRLTGGRGYFKNYEIIERGKVGNYSDIYSVGLGAYAGAAAFITDRVSFEVSLPIVSAGMKWSKQIESQEKESSFDSRNVSAKPNLLGLSMGVVFHF